MQISPWFPRGFRAVKGVTLRGFVQDGASYQIYETESPAGLALIARSEIARGWEERGLLPARSLQFFNVGADSYGLLACPNGALTTVESCPAPRDADEALKFAAAMKSTRRNDSLTPLGESVYVECHSTLLPIPTVGPTLTDDVVLGRYLTGGVGVSCYSRRRLLSLVTNLNETEIDGVIATAGLKAVDGQTAAAEDRSGSTRRSGPRGAFVLEGRPALESFFREHVIEIVENPERYARFGISFPSGIVLHGPPGCGKTFAVDRLVGYLDWPVFSIDSHSVASKYVHETSRKVATVFKTAMEQSPSVIVIDEMDAYLSDREAGGEHRVEEVAEFLRRIPEAAGRRVLIIGMTNRIELIDPAILRRGRFDHIVQVDMPNAKEVRALLEGLLRGRPVARDVDLEKISHELSGRALSDAAFVVRESARITARAGRLELDAAAIREAMAGLPPRVTDGGKPDIGFRA